MHWDVQQQLFLILKAICIFALWWFVKQSCWVYFWACIRNLNILNLPRWFSCSRLDYLCIQPYNMVENHPPPHQWKDKNHSYKKPLCIFTFCTMITSNAYLRKWYIEDFTELPKFFRGSLSWSDSYFIISCCLQRVQWSHCWESRFQL